MRLAQVGIVVLLVLCVGVAANYGWNYVRNADKIPKDIETNQDWRIANSEAQQMKYMELLGVLIVFPVLALLLAWLGAPRVSWLRAVLVFLAVLAGAFVVTAKLMHAAVDAAVAGAPPANETIMTAFVWAAIGATVSLALWVAIGRVYVNLAYGRRDGHHG
jgi:hypothetical protein